MKKLFCALVIPLLLMVCSINAYSQSNKGTEFWTCYMDHISGVGGATGSSMILYITSDVSTSGTVDISGTKLQDFTVTANAVTFIPIPSTAFMSTQGKFTSNGIHVTSLKPIAVYGHIYASSVSGATLLLPVNAMGKDYISLNYKQLSNTAGSYSSFAVVATEDNTTVAITPSAALVDGTTAGKAFNVVLNKGEVYQGLSATDLTGTKIQSISTVTGSCKKIAVFSGSSKIYIGCAANAGSSDNLFQQVYPTSTWGKNYVAAPLKARPYDVYRIVLSTTNTKVTLNGTTLNAAQFTNGLYYEFTSTTTNIISADQPIQVVQYSPTQYQTLQCTSVASNGDVGDPEMIYLSPIEQGLDHVTLYSTGYYKILQSYINVVIPTTAAGSFMLDGASYTSFSPIAGSSYSYAQIPVSSGPQATGGGGSVTSGTHTISASVPFNAIAYGFGSAESYGYAAGANLQDLNEYVAVQNPTDTTATLTAGCSNVSYKLQVAIPYQTTSITWKNDGVITYTDTAPVSRSTIVKNGTTLYVYENPKAATFTAGTHAVVATVFDPVADVCGSNVDIENDFTITDPAISNFTVAPSNCLGDITLFKDSTTLTAGDTEKSWLWDFGDNTTSILQNPTHTYVAGGNYSIHLTVTDVNGCSSVSAAKSVHVIARPVASFNSSTPDCAGQNLTFTSTSTAAEGIINKWSWDFGDGAVSTNQTPAHSYTAAGSYKVKLIVMTDIGCVSDTLTKTIVVNPLPLPDFTLPDVCLSDAYATFTNTSTIADHTESGFTYLWDFGDANATAANNQSTLKNPLHKYSLVGLYTVKLTVTSANGCVAFITHDFTVNGSTPKAAFIAENNCSADDIVFDDQSTVVEFGSTTKIVWYFDYNGSPGVSETYTTATMHADKRYTHHYPIFSSPATQTYNVRLDAYSGGSCVNTIYKSITINANPTITLTANGVTVGASVTLCQSDGTLQITENKNGFVGSGVFSGTGISATGLFDPNVTDPGAFVINYVFTAASTGCTYSTSFVVNVNATPTVVLPDTYTVLEGGQVTLSPAAGVSVGTITYKWTPSTGLSSDNIATPIATPSVDTKYTLTITTDKGCIAAAQTTVTVLKSPVVPNTFTPNNDGINDTWDILYLNSYPHCTVEVFNRYGERLYYSVGYPIPWNGQYKGADLPVGTYYYIINPNSGRKALSGSIAIIR